MIVINERTKLKLQTGNKTKVAKIVGYDRKSIYRWAKIFDVKELVGGWFIYFDESLYKK